MKSIGEYNVPTVKPSVDNAQATADNAISPDLFFIFPPPSRSELCQNTACATRPHNHAENRRNNRRTVFKPHLRVFPSRTPAFHAPPHVSPQFICTRSKAKTGSPRKDKYSSRKCTASRRCRPSVYLRRTRARFRSRFSQSAFRNRSSR